MDKTFFGFLTVMSLFHLPTVYADHYQLQFPWDPPGVKTTIHCTVIADMAAEVHIDTHNIDLRGACAGPFVVRPGHLKVPASVVNSHSFTFYQGYPRSGNVTIDTPPNSPINCADSYGGRSEFGDDEYC
jgi:hypothetical protein